MAPIGQALIFLCLTTLLGARAAGAAAYPEYRDERTGAAVRDLTPGLSKALVGYQTHPMWTANMEYLVFTGERDGKTAPYALHRETGNTRALLESAVAASVLESKHGRLYYITGNKVSIINVPLAFRGKVKPRDVASLPAHAVRMEGGISLDSKADLLYAGALLEEGKKWALLALDVSSGQWRTVKELDFQIGHVQANPSISRVILFCHETGGDAPQRIWMVNANGTLLRPFYKETYNEWVTHEVWWGGVRALFTIWPYDDEHKKKPHGVCGADMATGKLTIYSQFPAWHTHGSPDGKWIVADDFERNLWLIKPDTHERRLLTQGHLGKGFDTHPHPSFTPDSKSVVFTSSRSGAEHIFMVDLPAWESLPAAQP